MSNYDTPELLCRALSVFIKETLEQAAALRAYSCVFCNRNCENVFLQRAHDSIWRELISELARIFDKPSTKNKSGQDENCTLLRLKEMCLKEGYLVLFPEGEADTAVQALNVVIQKYHDLPIKKSRNKQLSHHDIKQLFGGECIEISFDDLECLILETADAFADIYNRYLLGLVEFSYPPYDLLVTKYRESLQIFIPL